MDLLNYFLLVVGVFFLLLIYDEQIIEILSRFKQIGHQKV